MNIHKSYSLVAALIVSAASMLFINSCDIVKVTTETKPLEISVKSPVVESGAGQTFVAVTCSSDWKLAMDFATAEPWAELNVTSGKGDKSNVILSYSVNGTGDAREVKITVSSGSEQKTCVLSQKSADKQDNTGGDEPQEQPDLSKKAWLELPAMDNPNLGYYTHSFTMDSKTYRNYSFGFSSRDGVALWVAYPLCKFYTVKNVQRTDKWSLDPLLGDDSPAPFGGYAEELARGHQLPSADRLCCREANEQTFYGSNMTPQLNEHNEGIWANLENSVRTWANTSDTTYVVTGCIVEGSRRVTTDSNGRSLTVPSAYFKAILRYSKSSTIAQWAGAAFLLEHKDYGKIPIAKEHSMSIDELEQITGMDFFVNLPAKIGEVKAAEIEAQNPADYSLWW